MKIFRWPVFLFLSYICAGSPAFPQWLESRAPNAMAAHAAARFLDQAEWGPTPASIAQLQQLGIVEWLRQQIALNTSDLPDQPILNSAGNTNQDLTPVQRAFFQNAVTGDDQLRQRVAFALSEIWVISEISVKAAYAFPPYWRIFRDNAFGNYRDLIRAVTLNPGMGTYLSAANNNKGDPTKGTAANENYAREVLQLFTIGLNQLNPDGSPVLDASGNPIPTYDNGVVTNLAKVFTGWTYPVAPGATKKNNNPFYYLGQMYAVEANHDMTAKTIFSGIALPAGQTAEADLESFLDAVMAQPTMAPFISQQLIQHLVTSNPSPAYVARISKVFSNDGSGTAGNLGAVVVAILTDPEARAGDETGAVLSADYGHMREPVLFMANLLRGLNATLSSTSAVYNQATQMGQQLFYSPTVFSYFSPTYKTQQGLLAPEFGIYSTQTAAYRADTVNTILNGTLDKGTTVDLSPFVQSAGTIDSLLSYINSVFLHGAMSQALYTQAYNAATAASGATARAKAALWVTLSSGEYQIIR